MQNYTYLLQNASTPWGVMGVANTLTDYLFGNSLILMIWIIVFTSIPEPSFTKKSLVSCFICLVLSYLFLILGVVSDLPLILNAVGLGIFSMIEIWNQRR